MGDSADLVVLGAGPAGLAAAWRAARAGHQVTVLDRAPVVGGMAGSFTVAGVRVDHGSHRLHPNTPPAILRDIASLLGGDLQTRPRNGRLRVAGRWLGFPLRPAELARRLPLGLTARIGLDALTAPLRSPGASRLQGGASRNRDPGGEASGDPGRDPGGADSYAAVLRGSLGPALYDALYAPYARKLWGRDGKAIDAEQARRRVSADTPWKIAGRMLRRQRTGQGRIFHYPRRGFGQIVEALADAAVEAGADLRLNSHVDRIESSVADLESLGGAQPPELSRSADHLTVVTSGGAEFNAARVFTTVPLPVLARLCRPGPPPGVLDDAGRLRFRAMTLVYLVCEGRPWTPYDAHYLPDLDTPVTRISEPANYRDSADDPAGHTVLCAELPCDRDDQVWHATDGALADLVREALARHDLPPVRLREVEVRRIPYVYPIYERGYAEHLRGLDEWASGLPRVTTFGRLGLFVHDNTHHAIAMAYDAVDALGDGTWSPESWAQARHRFTHHIVED